MTFTFLAPTILFVAAMCAAFVVVLWGVTRIGVWYANRRTIEAIRISSLPDAPKTDDEAK